MRFSLQLSFSNFRRENSAQKESMWSWHAMRFVQKAKGIWDLFSGKQLCISAAFAQPSSGPGGQVRATWITRIQRSYAC
eukprot:5804071-Heterocapsa_arctica.AAC.1